MTNESSTQENPVKRKRFFDWQTKEACWNKSQNMLGRDPD